MPDRIKELALYTFLSVRNGWREIMVAVTNKVSFSKCELLAAVICKKIDPKDLTSRATLHAKSVYNTPPCKIHEAYKYFNSLHRYGCFTSG